MNYSIEQQRHILLTQMNKIEKLSKNTLQQLEKLASNQASTLKCPCVFPRVTNDAAQSMDLPLLLSTKNYVEGEIDERTALTEHTLAFAGKTLDEQCEILEYLSFSHNRLCDQGLLVKRALVLLNQ